MNQAVILAAGESSRFWPLNSQHKSLFKIMGRPLIFYLIDDLKKAGIKEIIIVQGQKKDVERELSPFPFKNLKYVLQEKPLGTGDALLKAEKFIKGKFLLINAERIDAKEYLKEIFAKAKKNEAVLLADKTKMPHLFGILKIKGDRILDIVEKPRPDQAPSNLRNIGFYLLSREIFSYLKKIPSNPYSLIEAIKLLAKEKKVKVVLTQRPPLFLKFPWDLFRVKEYLFQRFLKNKVGKNSQISKKAVIEGIVQIEENVKIEEATIKGPCFIGAQSFIKSNSIIREYSNLERDVLIGSFSEVKNSIFQEGVHIHSGYFGDSLFDKNCRFGAGTITANRRLDREIIKAKVKGEKISTGLEKLGAIVGENSRIGINCSIMPGVMIGKNCIIGPHSFIKENVGDGKIFYTKFESFEKNLDKIL